MCVYKISLRLVHKHLVHKRRYLILVLGNLMALLCISCTSSRSLPAHERALDVTTADWISVPDRHLVVLRREDLRPLLLSDNLEIAAAKERVHEHQALYRAAWQHVLPVLQPGWTSVHVEGGISSTHGPVLTEESYAWTGSLLNWVINPGQAVYDLLLAHQALQTSRDQQRYVTNQLLHQTFKAYNELLLSRSAMLLARARVRQCTARRRVEELRRHLGTGLEWERLLAVDQESRSKIDLLDASIRFYRISSKLVVLLHLDSDVLIIPPDGDIAIQNSVQFPVDTQQAIALAIMNRPDLTIIRDQVKGRHLAQQQLLASMLSPQVQGTAMSGPAPPTQNSASTLIRETRQSWNVRWLMSPEWEGQIAAATARQKRASLEWAQLLDEVSARIRNDAARASAIRDQMTLSGLQEQNTEKSALLVKAQYQQGTVLDIDVLSAQIRLMEAHYKTVSLITQFNDAQDDILDDMGLLFK